MSRGRRRGQEEGQGPGRRILGTEARTQPPEPSQEDQDVRSLWVMRITRGFTDPGHGQQSGFPALSRELQFPRRRAGAALPTHPASLSIAAHTPLHSASLHTPRFTQHRCTHTASLSIAAHTPLHSASLHTHRIVATGWQTLERRSLPLKRKSHFFLTSPRGRRASDLLKEEEQQPGAHRLHVLRSCINTHKKCLHFLS